MMFAADLGTGRVRWSMLWFFVFLMWIMLVLNTTGDIFRSSDLSGVSKAVWTILIVVLSYLGAFVVLVVRGRQDGSAPDRCRRIPTSSGAGVHPFSGWQFGRC